ncbi:hypothetical protein PENTCL1PPCAC_4872, partial [Pristionchus entomophagus]
VLAAAQDINLDVAVEPFPLFPAIGGFCNGLLCTWGAVPMQYTFATTVILIGNTGGSIVICILYRHQSLVRGRFKFNELTIRLMQVAIIVIYSAPGILSFSLFFDGTRTDELIDNYAFGDLAWIRERGNYVLFVRSVELVVVLPILT